MSKDEDRYKRNKGDDNNESKTREVNIKLKYEIKVIIKIENMYKREIKK